MILLFPKIWLIVLLGNFIIDSLVFLLSMLADMIGSTYMFLMTFVFQIGIMGDELYLTIPALVISATLIYVFHYFITFKKMDRKLRLRLSLTFDLVTAPYTFLVPSSWLYSNKFFIRTGKIVDW